MTDPTTSLHVPPITAGEPAPCHPGSRLSGSPAVVWCGRCGRSYHTHPGEVLPAEQAVARAAAARAHELELERARHVPEHHRAGEYPPVSEAEAAAHRRALARALTEGVRPR